MVKNTRPICIIGAGIMGASVALHLVESRARDVVLIDAGLPLSGTMPAGAGFVARFGADRRRRIGAGATPLEEYGLSFYQDLHESGADIEFAQNGNVVIARTERVLDKHVEGILKHPQASPGTRLLDADGVAEALLGAVDPASVVGGIFMPDAIQVTTARVLQEILDRLKAADVTSTGRPPPRECTSSTMRSRLSRRIAEASTPGPSSSLPAPGRSSC